MHAVACTSRLRIFGLVCAAISVATSSTAQQPANVSDAVKQLLQTGWQPAFGSRKLVDEQFQGLPAAIQADARTKYAYGLVRIIGEIERLEILLEREKDPVIRQRLIRDIHRLETQTDRFRVDLLEIQRLAAVTEARLVILGRQMAMTRAQYNQALNRTAKERSGLERREKQIGAVERKAKRTTGDKRRSRTLAGAFTTYAPFPLEEEKRRLLDGL